MYKKQLLEIIRKKLTFTTSSDQDALQDADESIALVRELIEVMRDETIKNEPYATTTIARYEIALRALSDVDELVNYPEDDPETEETLKEMEGLSNE